MVDPHASDALPPVIDDQRQPGRKRVYLRGKIAYGNNGEYSLECLIQDISATGARISLKQNEFIPKHFFLIDLQSSIAYEAVVMWIRVRQTIPQFGLKFSNAHRLDYLSNPKLNFLKQLAGRTEKRDRRAPGSRPRSAPLSSS